MVEKKKEETKKAVKKAKAFVPKLEPKAKEDLYPAVQLAEILGISSFDFFMIKDTKNINDGTLLTMTEFQKLYQKIVEGR